MKKISQVIISLVFCFCLIFTSMLPAFAAVAQVKTLSVTAVSPTSVSLKWTKVSGATGYELEQYKSSKWKKITTAKTTSFKVQKLTLGTTYKFRVRALKSSGNSISYGKYSAVATVKTAPSQVAGIKVSSTTSTSAIISWSKTADATGYRVQKLVDGKWINVVKSTTKNKAKLVSLAPGAKTSIRICAYITKSGKTYFGQYSKTFVFKPAKLSAPKAPKATAITPTSVNLSWNKVSGATNYIVYSISGATQKELAQTTKTSCTVTGLDEATSYILAVRASTSVNAKNYYSPFSENLSVKTAPGRAATPVAVPTENEVALSWKASKGADGYQIYKYDPDSKKWVKAGSTTKTTYTVIRLEGLTQYKFKIRAYHSASSSKVYGEFSKAVSVTTLAGSVTDLKIVTLNEKSATISWTALPQASGYTVERSTNGKTWTPVTAAQNVSEGSVSVTESGLKINTEYIFRVSPVISGTPGTPAEINVKTAPGKVTGLVANDLRKTDDPLTGKPSKKINLEWNGEPGAMGYEISKYDSTNGWRVVAATESTVYSVANLNDDVEYSFRIRAFYTSNKTNYYGPYSDTAVAKVLPAQITGLSVQSITKDSATIIWDVHAKAEKYKLCMSVGNGAYNEINIKPVEQSGKMTVKLNLLNAGYTYSVKVYAIIGEDESYPSSVSFKTVPGKPQHFVSTDANDTAVTLAWDTVTGADYYEVEQYNALSNKYEKIETISVSTYVISNLIPANSYKFRVRACNETNGTIQNGDYSDILTVSTISASINGLTVSNITSSTCILTWNTISGATYKVEMSKNGGAYTSAGSPTITSDKVSVTVVSLSSATRYDFRVCAVNGSSDGAWYTTSIKTAPTAPTNFSAAESDSDVSTSWSAVPGADGYEVSMMRKGGAWEVVNRTTGTYYNISGLVPSTTYIFRVRAYTTLNSITSYSGYSDEKPVTTRVEGVTVTGFAATTKSDSSVELSWNYIPGASYMIEKSENGSTYSRVSVVPVESASKVTALVTGLKSGTKYYFKICATVSGTGSYSPVVTATTTGSSTVTIGTVSNLSATSSASGSTVSIKLSWAAYSGASYYLVKCDSPSMSYKTNSTSYTTSSGITAGRSYTFYVEAYNSSNVLIAKSSNKSCTAATPSAPTAKPLTGLTLTKNSNGKTYVISWDGIDNAVYSVERWNGSSWEQVPNYKFTSRVSIEAPDNSIKVNYSKKSDYVSTISWQSVSGVSSYSVQSEYSPNSDEWKTETTTTSTSVDLRLPPQSKQTIRVSALTSIKYRIRALSVSDETVELASSEYTANTYSSYGDVSFTTPSVSSSSSTEAKEAYTLMLVQAINNTKLERSKVSMTAKKNLKADIDTNSIRVNGMSMDLLFLLYPEFKKEFASMSNDLSENSVTNCDFEYGYGKGTVVTTDLDGKQDTKTKTLYLYNYVEPESSYAYLYNQHDLNAFSKGIESVNVSNTSDGGYTITIKLKSEEATASKDANYHLGFTENFAVSSKSLSDFGSQSKGSVSGTTITAKVNKNYTLDSIRIAGNFKVSVSVTESGYTIKSDFNGKVDSTYEFKR